MNNSLYEDYMRNVLGYQSVNNYQDTYRYNDYDNYFGYDVVMPQSMQTRQMTAMSNIQIQELESCYPDIYRIVYPMVQKACSENRGEVTAELIDRLTDEIYSAVEDRELLQNRGISESETNANLKTSTTSNKTEDRYCKDCNNIQRNTGVNDIIRILLLRELIGRPGFPGFRPPRPPPPSRPPRPPMRPPMGPGPGGGRPPRPRGTQYFETLDDSYDLYEK